MPTYAQLQAEPWWIREYQPPGIAELCRRLREFYRVDAIAIGSKGDNNHLYGYHRSAAWVRNSAFCTNRTYSVSETPGNRTPGDEDWLCAIDMTIPVDQLIDACKRLDVAVRAGQLEKITEWYGNDDGDNRVDGYNNVRNVVASSDSSHLWHLHLSFDRGRADEDHTDLYEVLTGTPHHQEDDMMRLARNHPAGLGTPAADLWIGDGVWRRELTQAQFDGWAAVGLPIDDTIDIATYGEDVRTLQAGIGPGDPVTIVGTVQENR